MRLLLRSVLFTLVVPASAAVYVPMYLLRGRPLVSGASLVSGALLLAIGVSVYLHCVWLFLSFGRGTPSPVDAPRHLVVRGVYRFGRNPMYWGVLATVLAWVVLYRSWTILGYAAALWLVLHLFVVFYEEPRLRRVFGGEYNAYCARVGRWIPRPPSDWD